MKPVISPSMHVRKSLRAEPLESRQLLSAVSPVVTGLLAPVTTGLQGTALTKTFSSLDRLIEPNAEAQSYLNLAAYTPFTIDFESLRKTLDTAPSRADVLAGDANPLTIAIPNPDGGYSRFRIFQSETMAPELAAQYPAIRTFTGQGIDDPTATLAMDYTLQGFHASVSGASGAYYIDPYYHLNQDAGEVAYWRKDNLGLPGTSYTCVQDEHLQEEDSAAVSETSSLVSGTSLLGGQLRTYDLAIGATGEYTAYHGGTKPLALSAITTVVARLNQVYETDFAIHFTLVANETNVIYTNSSSDPYTAPTNPSTSLNHNQSALDNSSTGIGSANYDIGHVFYKCAVGGDNGLAGLAVVGVSGAKARGYSAHSAPIGDYYTVDYVAHEMGHQFNGLHNWNNIDGDQDLPSSGNVEPGSGQTIMGYAGLAQDPTEDILNHSLAMFNANNFVDTSSASNPASQILQYTLTSTSGAGYTSATKSSTGNTPPTVQLDQASYNIPMSTPFALTAIGADVNGDSLSYSWEQQNGGSPVSLSSAGVPSSTTTTGPVFRVYEAVASPTRVFPTLSAVLLGRTYATGEQLPAVARTMKFSVLVRDNRAGGGGVAFGAVNVTTIAGTAFSLTSFNSLTTVIGGSSQTINWTNTSTGSGTTINAANVNILLSTDGGTTFPITLASNVANDGSETVTMPYNLGTNTARIKIVPTNNVFFDINNANFTITNVSNTSATPSAPLLFTSSDTGSSNSDGITKLNNSSAGSTLQFVVGGTVTGALVELLSDGVVIGSATAIGSFTTVTTNGTTVLTDNAHTITARQTESGKSVSPNSSSLSITVDATAPVQTTQTFFYETSPIGATFSFNEPIAVSGTGMASLMNLTTSAAAPSGISAAGNTATLAASGMLDDGNYHATIQNTALIDIAGNSPAADLTQDFFFVNADANRDRFVDPQDFNLFAANFGGTSKVFSQGNFNYDAAGDIDSADFSLFVAQYGKRLAIPSGPVASPFASTLENSSDDLEI